MTGYEKGELGIRQQGINLESQKLQQQSKMGEEALGIKAQQEKLNQQKSDQQHEKAINDLQRKQDEYKQKMDLAYTQLNDRNTSAEAKLEIQKSIMENMKAYHESEMAKGKLEMEQKDRKYNDLKEQHDKVLKQNQRTVQTKTDSAGNKITTETTKGDAADMVDVVGPNGVKGKIPRDKLDDWNKNHAPQPDDQQQD